MLKTQFLTSSIFVNELTISSLNINYIHVQIKIKKRAIEIKIEKYLLAFLISYLPILYPTKVVDAY